MSLPKFNEIDTCHFVTSKVWQNIWLFKNDKYSKIIIDNLNFYRKKFNYRLVAFCILPWHLHLILKLSEKWNDISKVIQDFKKFSAVQIVQQLIKDSDRELLRKFSVTGQIYDYPSSLGKIRSINHLHHSGTSRSSDRDNVRAESKDSAYPIINDNKRRKYSIWLPDNYDFNIYSYKKLEQKVNYVNYNAVKHGLVKDPNHWKYSSFRNYEYNDHSIIKIEHL